MVRCHNQAVRHHEFCMALYPEQIKGGRYFVHEQPASASSWNLYCTREVGRMRGVVTVRADMCQFGLKTAYKGHEGYAMKPTRFMTNSPLMAVELSRVCSRNHEHIPLLERRAGPAAMYTEELCRCICKGIMSQKLCDRSRVRPVGQINQMNRVKPEDLQVDGKLDGKHEEDGEDAVLCPTLNGLKEWYKSGEADHAWDDVTGAQLEAKEVRKAREDEMKFIRDMNVYDKVPRSRAWRAGKKVIGVRWIDINKGDCTNPKYRSRMVAKEFKDSVAYEMFAATPPVEALRMIVSWAASWSKSDKEDRAVMACDISRAFFHAEAGPDMYVELSEEDQVPGQDLVGRLRLALYGTREAAAAWQKEVSKHLKQIGFQKGTFNPCLFYHPGRQIRVMVHGDDYAAAGPRTQLSWMHKELEKRFGAEYVKTEMLSKQKGDAQEITVLNRVIRVMEEGMEMEADVRHAEIIARELAPAHHKPVMSPGLDYEGPADEYPELAREHAQAFRKLVARANYISIDRPDIAFAVKELCRRMSKPTEQDWNHLVRLGKFLNGRKRAVQLFEWQQEDSDMKVYADSNFAGCKLTRKSTSGGCVMIGKHYIRGWSKTQAVISLSSGEAELAGIVKGTCEAIGAKSISRDLGHEVEGVVFTDSSAALSMTGRIGAGKIRHLDTSMLWVQQKQTRGEVEFQKVLGSNNVADLWTKNVDQNVRNKHMLEIGFRYEEGRAGRAAELNL